MLSGGNNTPESLNANNSITNFDIAIAQNQYFTSTYQEAQHWPLQRYLYRKLYYTPSLIVPNTVIDTFWQDIQKTAIPRLFQVRKGIQELAVPDTFLYTQLESGKDVIQRLTDSLYVVYTILHNASGQDSIQALALREVYRDSIASLLTQHQLVVQAFQAAVVAQADQLIVFNSSIQPVKIYEENEKKVNDIYLRTIAKGIDTFSQTQVNTLRSIALQCIYEGGRGVVIARKLYKSFHKDTIFNDDILCQQISPFQQLNTGLHRDDIIKEFEKEVNNTPTHKRDDRPGITMYPNPVTDVLVVEYDLKDIGPNSCVLRILNTVGESVLSVPINVEKGRLQVSLSALNPAYTQHISMLIKT